MLSSLFSLALFLSLFLLHQLPSSSTSGHQSSSNQLHAILTRNGQKAMIAMIAYLLFWHNFGIGYRIR